MSGTLTNAVLVLVERAHDTVADATLETLSAARQLADLRGGEVVAVVLAGPAETSLQVCGADRCLVVRDDLFTGYSPAPWLDALGHLIATQQPCAVLLSSTSIGLDVGPQLAARHHWPVVMNCRSFGPRSESAEQLSVTAGLMGGKLLVDVEVAMPAVLLIGPGAFPRSSMSTPAPTTDVSVSEPLDTAGVEFEGMLQPETEDVDISQEDVLVAVGRGVQQEDNLEIVERLAEVLGGAVAASRPVVDQGWLPATRQVGKSGMKVAPKCYLALGISGAPEHVEGMQDAELILAINTDAQAPIFEVAHFGAVADMLDVAEALADELQPA